MLIVERNCFQKSNKISMIPKTLNKVFGLCRFVCKLEDYVSQEGGKETHIVC